MREHTRLPTPERLRLVVYVAWHAAGILALLAVVVWGLYQFTLYMNDMRQQIREERQSHRTLLSEHTTFLVEHQRAFDASARAFDQMLDNHQAQMRALQEGR